jgi:hypothetical protein
MPHLVCNYVHKIMLHFYVYFLHFLTIMWLIAFLCLASSSSYALLSQTSLLEVPMTYLGSLGYYLARGLMLLNDYSSKKLMLYGVSRVCSLLSLVLYPKLVHFASLMLIAEY